MNKSGGLAPYHHTNSRRHTRMRESGPTVDLTAPLPGNGGRAGDKLWGCLGVERLGGNGRVAKKAAGQTGVQVMLHQPAPALTIERPSTGRLAAVAITTDTSKCSRIQTYYELRKTGEPKTGSGLPDKHEL